MDQGSLVRHRGLLLLARYFLVYHPYWALPRHPPYYLSNWSRRHRTSNAPGVLPKRWGSYDALYVYDSNVILADSVCGEVLTAVDV